MSPHALPSLLPEPSGPASLARGAARQLRWLIRPRRVLFLLAAIWILNIFDLSFTMMEAKRHTFVELNPFAARVIEAPTHCLVAYKSLLVIISSTILLRLCHHSLTEFGCWLMFFAYIGVALAWKAYYNELPIALDDPALARISVAMAP